MSGMDNNIAIYVYSPIKETAVWAREYSVEIDSPLPVSGDGIYLEGDEVTIKAIKSEGLIIRNTFKKWSGDIDSTDPTFNFIAIRDMHIVAEYEKNYTYFIAILLLIVIIVGAIGYTLLRR